MEARTFALTCLLLLPSLVLAQKEMATDRPDQTETSSVVPAGWLQIESGISAFDNDAPGPLSEKRYAVPDLLLRLGMNERFEFRLSSGLTLTRKGADEEYAQDGYSQDEGTLSSEIQTLEMGIKTALTDESGLLPEAAFIFMLGFPGKNDAIFDIEAISSEASLSVSHSLGEHFSLGCNLGLTWDGVSSDYTGIYTLALGTNWSEVYGSYIEVYGDLSPQGAPIHRFDGGLVYLATPDLQLDVSYGFRNADITPLGYHGRYKLTAFEQFIAVGCSWRTGMW